MSTPLDKQSFINKYVVDINNYKIVKKINTGGFGTVFSIQDKKTQEKYAAKILFSKEDEEQNKIFINREIGIMIRIQHPTIIHFIGFSFQDFDGSNNVTLIMNYAENGSLSKLLQNAKKGLSNSNYDNTARQKILIGIAYGMMHLHKNRIIHRDLKPGNILLDENLHPLITDFGISKIVAKGHSQTQTQSYGTTIYMAPEVIKGDNYNEKADVYSFSILMFEVITDIEPYPLFQNNKMSLFTLTEKVVNENYRPEFKAEVKESLKKLITKCWSKTPSDRPSFEEIFNMLAFNLEDSVYDVFESEDENKFYLDNVDVNEVLSYAYNISESDSTESIIKQLKKDNDQIREQMKNQSILIKKLTKDNDQLKKDNEEIMKRLLILEQKIKTPEKSTKSLERLTKSLKKPEKQIKIQEKCNIMNFPYKLNELDGIFNYLTRKTNGNIHDNGTIQITTNSIFGNDSPTNPNHPKSLVEFVDNKNYCAASKAKDVWICFDFKDMEVEISNYTIKSSDFRAGIVHLKNWKIEVSNDNHDWTIIDIQTNNSDLNGPLKFKTFSVKENNFSRYCRIYNLGDFWGSDKGYDLEFNSIEFFGRLRTSESKHD